MKMLEALFIFLFVFFSIRGVHAKPLNFDDYIGMVIENNIEIKAIQARIDSVRKKLSELKKVYAYSLSVVVSYNDDKNRSDSEVSEKPETKYGTSLEKNFATGTHIDFGFNRTFDGHSFGLSDKQRNVNGSTIFAKVQQSLWKDINGGFTKANIAKAIADANSILYKLEYKKQNILFNAKNAYWDLSYSREIVFFKKLSLSRTKKIMNLNQKKYNMGLIERSDLLQSQIAVKLRELNLKLAYEEEDKSDRVFNQFLNFGDTVVAYEVEKLLNRKNNFRENKVLVKKVIRFDVLSALEDVKSALFDHISYKKNSCGDLLLRGHYILNSVDKRIMTLDKPSYYVGAVYMLPLDFRLRRTVNKGYESAEIAARKFADCAAVQEKVDWIQIVDNWRNANERLSLVVEIESIERQRHLENRFLFSKGRITTYQILRSEQDMDDAILSVLQNILELLKINNKAKTFYDAS